MLNEIKKLIKYDMNDAAKMINAYSVILKDINTNQNKRYTLYKLKNSFFGVSKHNGEVMVISQYKNNDASNFPDNLL